MAVLVKDIPMKGIKYQVPKHDSPTKLFLREKIYPQTSETPNFVQEDHDSKRWCALPTGCLSVMPCHEGHVPVRCSGKLLWSQTLGSQQTFVIVLLFSKLLETPIYVQINLDPSFLGQFIRGEIQVFFPMPIVQKRNQVWSISSNEWELIKKPKPRNADWKWNDSTATWVCEHDPTNKLDGLKLFDRSKFSNCGF